MKYAIVKVTDGNYGIHTEGHTTLMDAKASYFGLCRALCTATDYTTAEVRIMDENLDTVEDYKEFFKREVTE